MEGKAFPLPLGTAMRTDSFGIQRQRETEHLDLQKTEKATPGVKGERELPSLLPSSTHQPYGSLQRIQRIER
jgi:hypothetical protein